MPTFEAPLPLTDPDPATGALPLGSFFFPLTTFALTVGCFFFFFSTPFLVALKLSSSSASILKVQHLPPNRGMDTSISNTPRVGTVVSSSSESGSSSSSITVTLSITSSFLSILASLSSIFSVSLMFEIKLLLLFISISILISMLTSTLLLPLLSPFCIVSRSTFSLLFPSILRSFPSSILRPFPSISRSFFSSNLRFFFSPSFSLLLKNLFLISSSSCDLSSTYFCRCSRVMYLVISLDSHLSVSRALVTPSVPHPILPPNKDPSEVIGIIVPCLTQPKSCVPKNSTSVYPSGTDNMDE
mmetsp:Transcript_5996/g.6130  ORF Transcript_5996/g.6130 Transcript_5996/m.6130 type:complete len:300 (+) Transcript_5996:225-1124(+)